MDFKAHDFLLHLLLTILQLFSNCARGQSSYIIDNVGLLILPATTVSSGTSVTLQCQVSVSHDSSARLTHIFQLMRDDFLIYTETTGEDKVTFELSPSRAADSGSYECRVTVKEKSRKSFSQKLEVTGLQSPVLILETNEPYEGIYFTATCSAPEEKGSLIFRFLRRYNNEEPQGMKQVSATGNSSETKLALHQAGDYFLYCEYDINLVSGTRRSNHSNVERVMVKALKIRPVMNVLPSTLVYEGDLVEVVCRVHGPVEDIHIFLTKNKRILNETTSPSLRHVFRAQESDSGELVCKAEWQNVQKETYYPITVKELFSKPRLIPEPLELFEGDRLILTCNVTVYVPAQISLESLQFTIYKNNIKITPSQTYITMAHPRNNGNYTCQAATNVLSRSIIKESQTVVVEAKVIPSRPVLKVVNGTLILGKAFQLHCHSDNGTLPIKYTLQGPGGFIEHRTVSRPEDKAIFTCPPIYKSSDLNTFLCHSRNSLKKPPMVGSVSKLFQTTKIIEPVSKPVLIIHPHMGDVSEGQDLMLNCSVQSGTPPITFSWFHTERKGALNTKTSKKLEESHQIRNIQESHRGGYYCRSDNIANDVRQSYTVTVKVRWAAWKKGLIGFFCILLVLVLIIAVAFRKRLRQFKRKQTVELSVKSAGTKAERLSLTQADMMEAANATPSMIGKSVWSEHVSVSESDDQRSEAATEAVYTGPEEKETKAIKNDTRNSKHDDAEQADGQGSVQYAELNQNISHHGDQEDTVDQHTDHVDHGGQGDPSVQQDHLDGTETDPTVNGE